MKKTGRKKQRVMEKGVAAERRLTRKFLPTNCAMLRDERKRAAQERSVRLYPMPR
jgi:hypothetical protein